MNLTAQAAVDQAHKQFGDPNEPTVLQFLRGLSATWRKRPGLRIRASDAADLLDQAIEHLERNRWIINDQSQ